jgi:hypothetical protein
MIRGLACAGRNGMIPLAIVKFPNFVFKFKYPIRPSLEVHILLPKLHDTQETYLKENADSFV